VSKWSLTLFSALALSACSGNPASQGSLQQNVADAFGPCNENEIRFTAEKYNLSTAFRPCSSNEFTQFAWSPDGTLVFFQLVMSGYVMDATSKDKQTAGVGTPTPTGQVAWLTNTRLAVPVGPSDGKTARIMTYDVPRGDQTGMMVEHAVPQLRELDHVHRGASPSEIYFTAVDDAGARQPWHMDLNTDVVTRAFSFHEGAVDYLDYTPDQRAVTLHDANGLHLFRAETGEQIGSWSDATAGSLHKSGQWMALEYLGPEISIFNQRRDGELTEAQADREARKIEKFKSTLPDAYKTEVAPPTLGIVDLVNDKRWEFDGFFGNHFEWYEAHGEWASFMLWGFEGKQMRRNVVIGDFGFRLEELRTRGRALGARAYAGDNAAPPAPEAPSAE